VHLSTVVTHSSCGVTRQAMSVGGTPLTWYSHDMDYFSAIGNPQLLFHEIRGPSHAGWARGLSDLPASTGGGSLSPQVTPSRAQSSAPYTHSRVCNMPRRNACQEA
jgi:hypothetical protein